MDEVGNTRLEDAVRELAYARRAEAEYKAEIAEAEEELKADPLYQYVERRRELLRVARSDAADALEAVRKEALATYGEDGDTQPHPAVKIKLYTVVGYERKQALEYCHEHLPQALEVKLNEKVFEGVAKAAGLDFVTVAKEPRATVARDLSEYLPAWTEEPREGEG